MTDTTGRARQARSSATPSMSLAADSRTIAIWTLASRLTGFVRVATVAAVLGPTFFGNLFQTALFIPYVVGEILAGTLLPAILAPRLVAALAAGDRSGLERVAGGFLGVLLPIFGLTALAVLALSPVLLPLLTAAVDDPAVRARQLSLGWPLLLAMLPQIPLIAVIGVGIAIQHAHHRFAWPTAAPILENAAFVAVLGVAALVYGTGLDVTKVTTGQAALLGLGSTLAVALQAAAQLVGVRRLGVRLRPRFGWRDPDVRGLMRLAAPSSTLAGLNSLALLALMVACGHVPGGAVAFQIANNLFNLPIALGARPIGAALLPQLARSHLHRDLAEFARTYRSGLDLALFLTLPASLLFLGLPQVLATAVAFGQMQQPQSIALLAAAIAGLAAGIVGEAVLIVSTSAAYARHDARSPLVAATIRIVIVGAGIAVTLGLPASPLSLALLGATHATAAIAAALFLTVRQLHQLPADATSAGHRWISHLAVAAAATALPAAIGLWVSAAGHGAALRVLYCTALVLLAGATYLLVQRQRAARELELIVGEAGAGSAVRLLVRMLGPHLRRAG